MPKTTTKAESAPTFESALAELETIVTRMEDGQLSLDQSLGIQQTDLDIVALDDALKTLAELDSQQAHVVELQILQRGAML